MHLGLVGEGCSAGEQRKSLGLNLRLKDHFGHGTWAMERVPCLVGNGIPGVTQAYAHFVHKNFIK